MAVGLADALERFIPACAGNSYQSGRYPARKTVHPRVCGEQLLRRHPNYDDIGSSPRVRGTAETPLATDIQHRFIPACAGNRSPWRYWRRTVAVHPRVCGEQESNSSRPALIYGSSPRVRGTGNRGDDRGRILRFIPACAGNSPSGCMRVPQHTVHPRVCGEQLCEEPWYSILAGSSPRVRGTGRGSVEVCHRLRFIPACAGNRDLRKFSLASQTVHPRVCEEQTSLYVLDITHFPRGWKSYRHNARRNSPPWSGHPLSGLSGIGVKLTSFSPSKSRGIRRFVPTVSKSNP